MAVVQKIYANALFEAAKQKRHLDEVRGELREFLESVEQIPELRELLLSPQVDPAHKLGALAAILADADELVRNFLLLVTEKGRAAELDEIVREFDALVAAEEGVLDVELTTAVELSESEAQRLLGQIEQVSRRRLRASRRVDPGLIGGFVLRAGSHRADASVRGRLEGLRRQLTGSGRS